MLWTIYLGQLEGISVLGLLFLPLFTPLAIIKPQVSFFAFLANKKYILILLMTLLISFLIWGIWPINTFSVDSYYEEGRYEQDISIGWKGLFIAVPLLWLSRGDMDMLMLAGSFCTLHLIPYNLLPVVPSIGRLKPLPAFVSLLFSFLPFSANWLGPKGWWLGWFFVCWLWINLAIERYPKAFQSLKNLLT